MTSAQDSQGCAVTNSCKKSGLTQIELTPVQCNMNMAIFSLIYHQGIITNEKRQSHSNVINGGWLNMKKCNCNLSYCHGRCSFTSCLWNLANNPNTTWPTFNKTVWLLLKTSVVFLTWKTRTHRFICQSSGTRNNSYASRFMNVTWHDTDFTFPRLDDTRTVWSYQSSFGLSVECCFNSYLTQKNLNFSHYIDIRSRGPKIN